MKKKLFVIPAVILGLFILTGCGPTDEPNDQNNNNDNNDQNLSQKIEGLTITIGDISVDDYVGNMDQNGDEVENGEYFMDGEQLVNAADYKQVTVPIQFKNDNDSSYYFSVIGWKSFLDDISEENRIFLLMLSDEIVGEVKPNSNDEGTAYVVVKSEDITDNKLVLVYDHVNYNDEWQSTFQKYIDGEITYEDYEEQYSSTTMKFELEIE